MNSIIVSRNDRCVFFDKDYLGRISGLHLPQYIDSKDYFYDKHETYIRVKISDILLAPIVRVLSERDYDLLRPEEVQRCYDSSGNAREVCRYVESVWEKGTRNTLKRINLMTSLISTPNKPGPLSLIVIIKFLKTQYQS